MGAFGAIDTQSTRGTQEARGRSRIRLSDVVKFAPRVEEVFGTAGLQAKGAMETRAKAGVLKSGRAL